MAYRRKAGCITRATTTLKEEQPQQQQQPPHLYEDDDHHHPSSPQGSPSIAARAIRASAAHRDTSAYASAYSSSPSSAILSPSSLSPSYSFSYKEGETVVEHKTTNISQETRDETADICQIRRRGGNTVNTKDQATVIHNTSWQRPVLQPVQTKSLANQDTQLKASRDVAMATAAKAKLLIRELKTVKSDLTFAKERCSQLEEENKRLRESRFKGDNPTDDDDLIRLQLETLLAEKARLGHENSIYARENRFLREIVEYHQLTTREVMYIDDGITDEVSDTHPFYAEDEEGETTN